MKRILGWVLLGLFCVPIVIAFGLAVYLLFTDSGEIVTGALVLLWLACGIVGGWLAD